MGGPLLVLAFDGAVCDGVDECLVTAVNAHRPPTAGWLVSRIRELDAGLVAGFRRWRYLASSVAECGALLAWLHERPDQHPTAASFTLFCAGRRPALEAFGARFVVARRALRDTDPDAWFALHRRHPEAVEGWRALRARARIHLVTSRDRESTRRLVAAWDLGIPDDQLWTRETFVDRTGAVRRLARAANVAPADVTYVDDHPERLRDVAATGAWCLWASWGRWPHPHTAADGAARVGDGGAVSHLRRRTVRPRPRWLLRPARSRRAGGQPGAGRAEPWFFYLSVAIPVPACRGAAGRLACAGGPEARVWREGCVMTNGRKTRRNATAGVLALVACGAGLAGCQPGPPPEARPNLVLIVVDTLRPDVLGCYGDPRGLSPHIDALARDGILFEHAVCPSPITGPSHATLFSGRLPSDHGVRNNSRIAVPDSVALLAEVLQAAGYATGGAVSIGPLHRQFGFARGFDAYADRLDDAWILPAPITLPRAVAILDDLRTPFFWWTHFADPHEPYDAHDLADHHVEVSVDGAPVTTLPTSTYTPWTHTATLVADSCVVALAGNAPFVLRNLKARDGLGNALEITGAPLWEALDTARLVVRAGPDLAPGDPVQLVLHCCDVIFTDAERTARYAREVAFVDRHVGALLDTLRARDLYDDAFIVLVSDHGEALFEHDHVGHIENLYDELVRVALIVKPPRGDGARRGQRRGDLAGLVDVTATILARLELPLPPGAGGRDLLAPDADDDEHRYFLETHPPEAQRTRYGLRDRRCKLVWTVEDDAWEFYDLATDPGERQNLYGDRADTVAAWRVALAARLQSLAVDQRPDPDDVHVDERTREMLKSLGY